MHYGLNYLLSLHLKYWSFVMTRMQMGASLLKFVPHYQVGWLVNVPFRHKNRYILGQGLGWRFSSTGL